jgi:hypothetical protein
MLQKYSLFQAEVTLPHEGQNIEVGQSLFILDVHFF